jgi:hypothetical protein
MRSPEGLSAAHGASNAKTCGEEVRGNRVLGENAERSTTTTRITSALAGWDDLKRILSRSVPVGLDKSCDEALNITDDEKRNCAHPPSKTVADGNSQAGKQIACTGPENQRDSKSSHSVVKMSAATVNRRVATNGNLSKLVHLRAAQKPASDARTAT